MSSRITKKIICNLLHVLHITLWFTIAFGLLCLTQPLWLWSCILFCIFVLVSWQITGYCVLNYLKNMFDPSYDHTSNGQYHTNAYTVVISQKIGMETRTLSLCIQAMIDGVLLIGMYRLYRILSKEKGFF